MEIEIEIFYHSDETIILENNEVEYSVLECDTKMMTFYNISCIAPYLDEPSGKTLCKIHVGNTSFISPKDYEEIKKLISESNTRERTY